MHQTGCLNRTVTIMFLDETSGMGPEQAITSALLVTQRWPAPGKVCTIFEEGEARASWIFQQDLFYIIRYLSLIKIAHHLFLPSGPWSTVSTRAGLTNRLRLVLYF